MNHVNMRLLGARVPYTKGLPAQLTSTLVWNGQFAVQMFFAVSGFLITSTSIRRWKSPDRLRIKDFYLLRFARIAPLMLLVLAVLSALHALHVHGFVVQPKTGGLSRALLAALTFHINYLEATRDYLPGNWDILWSLSVEEMFYLFFPIFARTLRSKRFLAALLALFIVAGPFARMKAFNPNPIWREYSYLGGMDAIAMGCLTAILLAHKPLSRTWVRLCGWLGAALLVFILCFSLKAYALGLGRTGLDMTVIAIGACLVIAASSQSQWQAPRILSPLLMIGQRSYETYLTHEFLVIVFFSLFVSIGKPLRLVPELFAAIILASGLLGWLVAVTYAEPINRLIRRRGGDGPEALGSSIPQAD